MRKKRLFQPKVVLILFLILALPAFPQRLWTLSDCIGYALLNNLDIKKQLLNVQVSRSNLLQSKLDMLPDLNASATNVYNWGKTIDLYTNTFAVDKVRSNNFSLSSNLTVFNGMQKINTMQKNKIDLLATQFDLDVLEDDISLSVAGFYLDILFKTELLETARNQADIGKEQVKRVQKLVEAGTVSKGDLLNVQAQSSAEDLQVINADNNLKLAYLSLMQLIDLSVDSVFIIEKPQIKSMDAYRSTITPEEIFQVALSKRPEIQGAEMRVKSAQKSIAIARGMQSPSLSIGGTWGTGYSGADKEIESAGGSYSYKPIGVTQLSRDTVLGYEFIPENNYKTKSFRDQIKDNDNKSLGFYLRIPIFNNWQIRTAITQAKIARDVAEYDREQKRNNLRKSIEQADADAVAAAKKHKAAQQKVEAQQEAFKYAQQKFDVGILNSFDYNNTKKELANAQSELIQAKYDFLFRATILKFYMGLPISLE